MTVVRVHCWMADSIGVRQSCVWSMLNQVVQGNSKRTLRCVAHQVVDCRSHVDCKLSMR